jgi:hypothetical protein
MPDELRAAEVSTVDIPTTGATATKAGSAGASVLCRRCGTRSFFRAEQASQGRVACGWCKAEIALN